MGSIIWLIALPLLAAFVSVVAQTYQYGLLVVTLLMNLLVLFAAPQGLTIIGGYEPPFGISLLFDQYALIALLLIQVLLLLIIVLARPLAKNYTPVILVMLAGLNGMLLTNDLFNLFVMIEIVSIAAFILSTANGKLTHTFHYLILATVSGVFFLLGTVLVYAYTGILVVQGLMMRLASLPVALSLIPMMLLIFGMAVELKLVPVSSWAKNIYGQANLLTGPIFAAVLAPAFGFVFGRMMNEVIVLHSLTGYTLLVMAISTFVLGELAAYRQTDLLKTLAFSSIGQSGLAVMMFTLGAPWAGILLLINNALAKSILYGVATGVTAAYGNASMGVLKGVFYHHRLLGVAFSLASLSLVGIPLFLGFFAKVSAVMAIFSTGLIWVPVIILLTAIVEGAYVMRWLLQLWSPAFEGYLASKKELPQKRNVFSAQQILVVGVLAVILFTMGLMPQRFVDALQKTQPAMAQYEMVGQGEQQ